MSNRLTHEEFVAKVEEKYPGKYTILGEYTGWRDYIKVKYNECGHIKDVAARSILEGCGCLMCRTYNSCSHEEFVSKLEDKFPGRYTILSQYTGWRNYIKVQYNECGHIKNTLADALLKGTGCAFCNKRSGKTHEEFVSIIEGRFPGKYTILNKYTGVKNSIEVKYNECGHTNIVKPEYLRQGRGCYICHCSGSSQEEFEEKFYDIFNKDEFQIVGEYVNTSTPIKIKHLKCDNIMERRPDNLFTRKKMLLSYL